MIDDVKTYQYLSNGNLTVPGLNDVNEYEDTREAMNIMGMSEDEQSGEKGWREGEGRGGGEEGSRRGEEGRSEGWGVRGGE